MFEHSDEGKFWEVWAEGDKIFTRHGKLGANGQTKIKTGNADELTKMVKDKIREGYVQTGGDVDKGPELDKKELKKLSLVDDKAAKKIKAAFPDLKLRSDGDSETFHFRYVATVE